MSGLILQFAYSYTDDNRQKLKTFGSMRELENHLRKINSVELFATYADNNGLKRRNLMIQKSHKLLERFINSRIIYNMMGEAEWVEYLNSDDPAIRETLRIFKEGKAFPRAEKTEKAKKVAQAYDYRSTHVGKSLMAHA